MSQGTRSHIFGLRNEMDSVPFLTRVCLCNGHFSENYVGLRRGRIYHLNGWRKNMRTATFPITMD